MRRLYSIANITTFSGIVKRNKLVLTLYLLTLVPLALYGAGVFSTTFYITSDLENERLEAFSVGSVQSNAYPDGNSLISECEVLNVSSENICGIKYRLTDDITKGYDLSKFDHVAITVRADSPNAQHSIRLQLKNYDSRYSSPEDLMSMKYQGVTIDANESLASYSLDLVDFDVESWWLYRFQVGMEDSLADFSNVSQIEVVNNGFSAPGLYQFEITDLYLTGSAINLDKVVLLTMMAWLSLTIYSIVIYDRSLKIQLHTDPLTNTQNRSGLKVFLKRKANKGTIGLIYMDLDDFKQINDKYGHDAGDKVLITFADRVRSVVESLNLNNSKKCFVRMSGDEFAILVSTKKVDVVKELADSIIKAFEKPLSINGLTINLNLSIGVSFQPVYDQEAFDLFKNADTAMYFAKYSGKSQWQMFDQSLEYDTDATDKTLEIFKQQTLDQPGLWQFRPLFHLTNNTLDAFVIEVSESANQAIIRLLSRIKNLTQQQHAADTVSQEVSKKLIAFFNEHKTWIQEHDLHIIYQFPYNVQAQLGLTKESAKILLKHLSLHQHMSIALEDCEQRLQTRGLHHAQEDKNCQPASICINQFKGCSGNLTLLDEFKVTDVILAKSYLEANFAKSKFNERFAALNHFLTVTGASIIASSGSDDLDKTKAFGKANVDYAFGFIAEVTSDFSDIQKLKKSCLTHNPVSTGA